MLKPIAFEEDRLVTGFSRRHNGKYRTDSLVKRGKREIQFYTYSEDMRGAKSNIIGIQPIIPHMVSLICYSYKNSTSFPKSK